MEGTLTTPTLLVAALSIVVLILIVVLIRKPFLWEIYVPKYFNDGSKIALEHHKAWDEQVVAISNGLTLMKTAKGTWVSPQEEIFKEEMIPVRIRCNMYQIRKIGRMTNKHYEQEAVMYSLVSMYTKILPA